MYITTNFGAGLCNRLYESTILREFANYYNATVLLCWPELLNNAFTLPRTKFYDRKTCGINFVPFSPNSKAPKKIQDVILDRTRDWVHVDLWNYNKTLANSKVRVKDIEFAPSYIDYAQSFFAQYKDVPIFGMHVRRGDFAEYTEKGFGSGCMKSPDKWFIHLGEQVLKEYPDAKFFMATDTGDPALVNLRASLPTISLPKKDGIMQHVLELYALSILPVLFMSASTFSMMAKAIGEKTLGIWPKVLFQDISEELKEIRKIIK